jgi:hypothetical protein
MVSLTGHHIGPRSRQSSAASSKCSPRLFSFLFESGWPAYRRKASGLSTRVAYATTRMHNHMSSAILASMPVSGAATAEVGFITS